MQYTHNDIRFQIMNGDKMVEKTDPGLRGSRLIDSLTNLFTLSLFIVYMRKNYNFYFHVYYNIYYFKLHDIT